MGSTQSSPVARGIRVLADQYNKLRLDLLGNHNHSAGKGGIVDHADLDDGILPPNSHYHAYIETHLNGTTETFNDLPGGDMGVHKLGPAAYVLGALDQQFVIQAGWDYTDEPAYKCCPRFWYRKDITFSKEYDSPPIVIANYTKGPHYEIDCTPSDYTAPTVTDITTTGFRFNTTNYCKYGAKDRTAQYKATFGWIAVGLIAKDTSIGDPPTMPYDGENVATGPVAAGVTVLASHYNNLRTDLLTNHDHTDSKGGVVDHADLKESGPMPDLFHTHAQVEVHMDAESFTDSPGGTMGVHGLLAHVYVAGCAGTQLIMQAGQANLDDCRGGCRYVVFPEPFKSGTIPAVVIVQAQAPTGECSEYHDMWAQDVTSEGFTAATESGGWNYKMFHWLAAGETDEHVP